MGLFHIGLVFLNQWSVMYRTLILYMLVSLKPVAGRTFDPNSKATFNQEFSKKSTSEFGLMLQVNPSNLVGRVFSFRRNGPQLGQTSQSPRESLRNIVHENVFRSNVLIWGGGERWGAGVETHFQEI